jgi:hypothetical protein
MNHFDESQFPKSAPHLRIAIVIRNKRKVGASCWYSNGRIQSWYARRSENRPQHAA